MDVLILPLAVAILFMLFIGAAYLYVTKPPGPAYKLTRECMKSTLEIRYCLYKQSRAICCGYDLINTFSTKEGALEYLNELLQKEALYEEELYDRKGKKIQ